MSHIWRKLCTVTTILLLVAVLLLNQFGSPLACYMLERQVYSYLQAQGYGKADIADIRVIYNPEERYVYTAEVTFLDHAGYIRYYCYNSEQQIQALEKIGK